MKLSEEEVAEIRSIHKAKALSRKRIAELYKVAPVTIANIVNNLTRPPKDTELPAYRRWSERMAHKDSQRALQAEIKANRKKAQRARDLKTPVTRHGLGSVDKHEGRLK